MNHRRMIRNLRRRALAIVLVVAAFSVGGEAASEPRAATSACEADLSAAGVERTDDAATVLGKLLAHAEGLDRAGDKTGLANATRCLENAARGVSSSLEVDALLHAAPLYVRAGDERAAERALVWATKVEPSFCGPVRAPGNCETAESNAALATFLFARGRTDEGIAALERSLKVDERRERSTPLDWRRTAIGLLGAVAPERVVPYAARSFRLSERFWRSMISMAMRTSSADVERTLEQLEAGLFDESMAIHGMMVANRPSDPAAAELALQTLLLRRGFLLDILSAQSAATYESVEPEDERALARIAELRAEESELALAGASSSDATNKLARIRTELRGLAGPPLATALARHRLAAGPSVDSIVKDVAARLPRDGALVEMFTAAKSKLDVRTVSAEQPSYYALVLTPDGVVRTVTLEREDVVDAQVGRFGALLRDPQSPMAKVLESAQALDRMVFVSIRNILGPNVRNVFIAPEGSLQTIPFEALHDGKRFVVEERRLTYVTTGRDLLRRAPSGQRDGVVAFVDPDFAVGPKSAAASATLLPPSIPRLPGTRQEGQLISAAYPTTRTISGRGASKGAFLAVASPAILHVATHGIFRNDAGAVPAGPARGLVYDPGAATHVAKSTADRDALSAAALVFAGAENGGRGATSEGVVTARDILKMNLVGTELVTLSACESGVGEVRRGAGIYGFRRALIVAGARTIVSSLWRVDDAATRDLMGDFYARLARGEGRTQAMNGAAMTVRAKNPHPYFWAPFVVTGDSGPLRTTAPCVTPR